MKSDESACMELPLRSVNNQRNSPLVYVNNFVLKKADLGQNIIPFLSLT